MGWHLRYALSVLRASFWGNRHHKVLRESTDRIWKCDVSDAVSKHDTPKFRCALAHVVYYMTYDCFSWITRQVFYIWTKKVSGRYKDRLRGKFETFMDYMRDTSTLAKQHSAARVRGWKSEKHVRLQAILLLQKNWEGVGSAWPKQSTFKQPLAFNDGDLTFLGKNCGTRNSDLCAYLLANAKA